MRLYKISDLTEGNTTPVKWLGTNAECAAYRKELKEADVHQKDIATVEVDVPTDKAGLMAFLNAREAA